MRHVCLRCRRPAGACYCPHLAPTPSQTRVVFLQHPRERRVAIGTARMAHLALPNSELHVGVDFDGHARICALAAAASGETVVLFPAAGACEPEALPRTPRTLLVIDGTWVQARKMLARNAALRSLPRIGFLPARPGRYRIRREPAAHCRSTIEAVVEVLGRIEGDPVRFQPLLRAFDHMVETQLRYRTRRPNPYHRAATRQHQIRPDAVRAELRARWQDIVVVYGEANAERHDDGTVRSPELVRLVAIRPATSERLAAVIAPRAPLALGTPAHLGIAAPELLAGEAVSDAMARWRAFLRPRDLLCAWGSHSLQLLRAEGDPSRRFVDLRAATTRRLGRRAGGVEPAARLLVGGGAPAVWTAGRAGARIAALVQVVTHLAR